MDNDEGRVVEGDDNERHRIEGANHCFSGADQRHHLGSAARGDRL